MLLLQLRFEFKHDNPLNFTEMKNLYILFAALFLSASLSAQNVGVDQSSPANKLDVNGNLSIGATYSGTETAPANGAIIEGSVGVGIALPTSDLHIKQSASPFPDPSTGGLTLTGPSTNWQIWHSNAYLSFAYDGTRVAYVNNSTGDWVTTSDLRLKQRIEPMENTLDRVLALRPVSYHYLHQSEEAPKVQGFIAQEVELLFPEAVHTDQFGDMRGISYASFGVVAIKAIQEQQEIIDSQQAVIEDLVKRIEALEER